MLQQLRRLVWVDDSQTVGYLYPIVELLHRQRRLVVASLNYDNTLELLFSFHHLDLWTGIEEWSESKTLTAPKEGCSLLKLHGSIDWILDENVRSETASLPHNVVRRSTEEEMTRSFYRPAVVFGGGNKLTAEGPFLSLLTLFAEQLERADSLVIVGYSFRDSHVNELITRWVIGGGERRIAVIDPGFDSNESELAQDLRGYCSGRLHIVPLPAGGGGLMSLIDGTL
jgi:hypothetical protein